VELGREEQQKLEQRQYSALQALASGRVWYLVLTYFGLTLGIGAIAMRTGNLYAGLALAGVPLFLSATLVLLLPRKASATATG